jgi:cytochrome subunit of sulfide dehydrogenase
VHREGELNASILCEVPSRLPLLAVAALLSVVVASPSSAQGPGPGPEQGPEPPLIAQGCAGCHGQAGAGGGSVPRIAGYNRDLFIAHWKAFRDKQRPAIIMDRVAPGYTDAEVAVLADYFSKLK